MIHLRVLSLILIQLAGLLLIAGSQALARMQSPMALSKASETPEFIHSTHPCPMGQYKVDAIKNYLTCINSNTLGACKLMGAYAAGRLISQAAIRKYVDRFFLHKEQHAMQMAQEIFRADQNRVRINKVTTANKTFYEPNIVKIHGQYVDFANIHFSDLPEVKRQEYLRLSRAAFDEMEKISRSGQPINASAISRIEAALVAENAKILAEVFPGENTSKVLSDFEKSRAQALANRAVGILATDDVDLKGWGRIKQRYANMALTKLPLKEFANKIGVKALGVMSALGTLELALTASSTACASTTEKAINGSPPKCNQMGPIAVTPNVLSFLSDYDEELQSSLLEEPNVCSFYSKLFDMLLSSYTIRDVKCEGNTATIDISTKQNMSYSQTFTFRDDGSVMKVDTLASIFDDSLLALLRDDQVKEFKVRQLYNSNNREYNAVDSATGKKPHKALHSYLKQTTDLYYTELSTCCLEKDSELKSECIAAMRESPLDRQRRLHENRSQGRR